MSAPPAPSTPSAPSSALGLRVAAALVAGQAAGLAALGGYLVVNGLVGEPTSRADAEIAGALGLLGAVGLALVARGLLRRRRWARSPAVVAELVTLPAGWDLLQGGRWYLGVPLLAAAAGLLVLLFTPTVSAALTEEGYDGQPAG